MKRWSTLPYYRFIDSYKQLCINIVDVVYGNEATMNSFSRNCNDSFYIKKVYPNSAVQNIVDY